MRECSQNQSQLAIMKTEIEQAKHELTEEKSCMSDLLEELEELRLTAWIQEDCRFCAVDKQQRAESERKEMEAQLAKALKDRTVVEELLMAEQERNDDLSRDLAHLQEQRRMIEKIWSDEVSRLRGQLLVQQQWLPILPAFKLFQTCSFGEFLIGCLESFKSGVVTKTLDDVMTAHPDLDFTTHESYDPQAIVSANDDLMKAILSPPVFPLL